MANVAGTGALLTTTLLLLLLLLQPVAAAGGADAGDVEDLRYRRRRGFRHRNSPQTPTAPVQPVHPPPAPPAPRCNDTFGAEEALTASGDVCVPVPAPAPPTQPPRGIIRCPPCTCAAPKPPQRPFPGWPVPRAVPVPVPGRGGSTNNNGVDCVTPLMPMMMTCEEFITGNATQTPPTECCSALAAFLRASSTGAAAGRGDQVLECLCPVILGDVNRMMQKPVDPVRMMYLPIACGVVMPPQILYICFTGQQGLAHP